MNRFEGFTDRELRHIRTGLSMLYSGYSDFSKDSRDEWTNDEAFDLADEVNEQMNIRESCHCSAEPGGEEGNDRFSGLDDEEMSIIAEALRYQSNWMGLEVNRQLNALAAEAVEELNSREKA